LPYLVQIAPAGERQIRKLEAAVRRRIFTKLEILQVNPRPPGVEKLSGPTDLYRVRAGDFRIIYIIEDQITTVLVVKVGDRKKSTNDNQRRVRCDTSQD
jgi:mRNA interferase RelE/StbE